MFDKIANASHTELLNSSDSARAASSIIYFLFVSDF
jgi:hypothetical protein